MNIKLTTGKPKLFLVQRRSVAELSQGRSQAILDDYQKRIKLWDPENKLEAFIEENPRERTAKLLFLILIDQKWGDSAFIRHPIDKSGDPEQFIEFIRGMYDSLTGLVKKRQTKRLSK
jgi:hypothetical protein